MSKSFTFVVRRNRSIHICFHLLIFKKGAPKRLHVKFSLTRRRRRRHSNCHCVLKLKLTGADEVGSGYRRPPRAGNRKREAKIGVNFVAMVRVSKLLESNINPNPNSNSALTLIMTLYSH